MRTIHWLLAAAAISVGSPVLATPTTTAYDFGTGPVSGTAYTTFGDTASYNGLYGSTYFGNSATYSGTGGTALSTTVTAWATTGTVAAPTPAASGPGTYSGVNAGLASMSTGTIQNGVLTAYQTTNGGTGTYSGSGYALSETSRNTNGGNSGGNHEFTCNATTCTPDASTGDWQHALDNSNAYETLLFSFASAVTLSNVTLGFPSVGSANDPTSDLTVLYCKTTAAACATSTFAGQTYSQLVSSGNWGYSNLLNLSSSNDTGTTGLNVKSNYWMIGAFIADLPNQVAGDGVADYVKIRAISTCTSTICAVPEPDSLALFGIAGGALWLGRRRRLAGA